MKKAYPVVLSIEKDGSVFVSIPDFEINTQGKDIVEAIEMARDAIGIIGIDFEDEGKDLPNPSDVSEVESSKSDTITIVDVDFSEYRRKNDMRSVKKNCTIPSWLCVEAEKANINFSAVLQNALKQEMHLSDR